MCQNKPKSKPQAWVLPHLPALWREEEEDDEELLLLLLLHFWPAVCVADCGCSFGLQLAADVWCMIMKLRASLHKWRIFFRKKWLFCDFIEPWACWERIYNFLFSITYYQFESFNSLVLLCIVGLQQFLEQFEWLNWKLEIKEFQRPRGVVYWT